MKIAWVEENSSVFFLIQMH